MPNGLEVEDLFRAKPTGAEIAESGKISIESSQPVNVCFRPQASDQVLQAGADDKSEDMGPAEGSLAGEVDRIRHLRIPQAHSRDASNLGAEMDSACVGNMHYRTEEGQLPGKVPVFIPAIKWKCLVEAESVLTDGSHADAHVASVG